MEVTYPIQLDSNANEKTGEEIHECEELDPKIAHSIILTRLPDGSPDVHCVGTGAGPEWLCPSRCSDHVHLCHNSAFLCHVKYTLAWCLQRQFYLCHSLLSELLIPQSLLKSNHYRWYSPFLPMISGLDNLIIAESKIMLNLPIATLGEWGKGSP